MHIRCDFGSGSQLSNLFRQAVGVGFRSSEAGDKPDSTSLQFLYKCLPVLQIFFKCTRCQNTSNCWVKKKYIDFVSFLEVIAFKTCNPLTVNKIFMEKQKQSHKIH